MEVSEGFKVVGSATEMVLLDRFVGGNSLRVGCGDGGVKYATDGANG